MKIKMLKKVHVARSWAPGVDGYYATECGGRGIATHAYYAATCVPCLVAAGQFLRAAELRRAELDSELQAMGAIIIPVKDLGAALEALEAGLRAKRNLDSAEIQGYTLLDLISAAHLARLALGEAS